MSSRFIKIGLILITSAALVGWWIALDVNHAKDTQLNYLWQAGLSAAAILYGMFGLITASHWSWLKSGVGRGVFFISLGIFMWGLGQAGWAYYLVKDGGDVPTARILDILYSSSIPLWTYGIIQLSRATGAKYAFKKTSGKLFTIILSLILLVGSYYFLVVVARGGTSYFQGANFWDSFFDLSYAAGDAINLIITLTVFGLSLKYLGGRFKLPIVAILLSFTLIYLSDFAFSYYDGKSQYYNGHWSDLLYLSTFALFGVALSMLDPSRARADKQIEYAKAAIQTQQPLPSNVLTEKPV